MDGILEINHNEKRPFWQKALFLLTIVYFIGLVILAIFIYRASPGPDTQEILGVGIGQWQNESGIAYLSGRRLNCQPLGEGAEFATNCQVEIAGKTLEIQAKRNQPPNMMQLSGRCTAFYDGQEWPCKIGSRHVHVHWFAYLESPLGLNESQMDSLRQTYFIENLSEQTIINAMLATVVVAASLIVINFLVWLKPKMQQSWPLLFASIPIGIVSFFGMLIFSARVTNGFWD